VISVPVKVEAEGVGFLRERFAREKREDSLGEGKRKEAVNRVIVGRKRVISGRKTKERSMGERVIAERKTKEIEKHGRKREVGGGKK
jgi:hypothetical protein